ncbi:membrane protein FAM174A [Pseudophryne corroboree]|uniref:membrane protein FAM174A n=1 Tax=Pseudophryne corroboree TaxID=495146 RepID=UPI0030820A7E
MRGGSAPWPTLRWVTTLLCALCAFTCLPSAQPFTGHTSAATAPPIGISGPQPPVGVSRNGSGVPNGDLSSTAAAPLIPKPQTQRALIVLVLVSALVIIYFVIRTIRTRRKNKKTRKYGVLDTNIGNMELTPLDQEDIDDDTLFDANHPRR